MEHRCKTCVHAIKRDTWSSNVHRGSNYKVVWCDKLKTFRHGACVCEDGCWTFWTVKDTREA